MTSFAKWTCFVALATMAGIASVFGDPSPAPSGVPVIVGVAQTVSGWSGAINAFTTGGLIMSIGAVIEFVLRMVPSQKPLSLAYALDDTFKAIGSFFAALGGALEKILPNRLKSG